MSLESRLEQLGGELAGVKDELSRTREDLREILSRLGNRTDVADPSATIPPSPAPKAASRGGIEAPTSAIEGAGSRGGIGLSLDELSLVLGQAGPGGPDTGRGKAGFSVEGLAPGLKAAKGRGSSASDVADPRSTVLTMPLSDLAEMMKEAQASSRRSVEAPLDASPRSEGRSQASNATAGDAKAGPLPPMGQIARMLKGLLEPGQEAADPRPKASTVPKAKAGDKRHSSSEVGTKRTARRASKHERGARSGIRRSVTASHGPSAPEARGASYEGTMDANLMANLMGWTGVTKSRLGIRHLQSVLELYRLTGHLPAALDKAIHLSLGLRMMPDESDMHVITHDDLIDAVQGLHGIVYGSGQAPVVPAVEFDPAEAAHWFEPARGDAEAEPPTETPRIPTMDTGAHAKTLPAQSGVENNAVDRLWDDMASVAFEPEPAAAARPAFEQGRVRSHDDREESKPSKPGSERQVLEEALSSLRATLESPRIPNLAVAPQEPRKAAGIETGERSPVGPKGEASWSSNLMGSPHGAQGDAPDMRGGDAAGTRSGPVGPTGLTDGEWRAVEPLVPAVKPGGRPSKYERREILRGIVHQMRTGCSWRSLPDDLPPWKIVHHYYRTWREEGILERITETLAFQQGRAAPEAGWSANGDDQGPRVAGADGSAGKPGQVVASGALP